MYHIPSALNTWTTDDHVLERRSASHNEQVSRRMNGGLHWALVDKEDTLVALLRAEHFVPLPDVCAITRHALKLNSVCFLTDKQEFSIPEWYTWLAFEIPAFQIKLADVLPVVASEVIWDWEEIDPQE